MDFQSGIVKFFDGRDNKRFGFILSQGDSDVFFHMNGGRTFSTDGSEPDFDHTGRVNRNPQTGDRIIFEVFPGPKGPVAQPWGFEVDFLNAKATIANRPKPLRYRVMERIDSHGNIGEPKIVWGREEGEPLKRLNEAYPRDRYDEMFPFHHDDGFSIRRWIEDDDGSGWKKVDVDPREIIYGDRPVRRHK